MSDFDRYDLAGVRQQRRQHRPLAAASDRSHRALAADLQGSEYPELHGDGVAGLDRTSPAR
ncbi:MAG: hypothetical protein M3N57_07675 [Actinomycetota bacterium]|nr:hypothetical protein [Actinomycetota bacterium]